jgi:hypothetical protein
MQGYIINEYDRDKIYHLLQEPAQQTIEGDILRREFESGNIVGIQLKYIESGDILELELYPIFKKKLPGVDMANIKNPRRKEIQDRLNRKNAGKHVVRLVNANFSRGDTLAHLGYDEKHLPADSREAKRCFSRYVDRLRRWAKKNHKELKYIYVTEIGLETGRIHHHLITNVPREVCEDRWNGGKYPKTSRAEPDDFELTGFARYISEDKNTNPATGEKKWERDRYEKSYECSRNLEKPIVRTANTKISRRQAEKIAIDDNAAPELFERLYKDWSYLDKQVYYSDWINGYYINVRMRRRRRR